LLIIFNVLRFLLMSNIVLKWLKLIIREMS